MTVLLQLATERIEQLQLENEQLRRKVSNLTADNSALAWAGWED